MSDSESSTGDEDEAPPELSQAGLGREPETEPSVEASLTAISINQRVNQVQLLIPSLVQAVGDLADRHPDIAHKIVDDIIDKGQHRQAIEKIVVRGDDRRSDRAQVLAWVFAVLALLCGFVLMMTDRSTYGLILVATAVAPLVGVNIIGRISARRERLEKLALSLAPSMGESRDVDQEHE